jgi:hypothetical protein
MLLRWNSEQKQDSIGSTVQLAARPALVTGTFASKPRLWAGVEGRTRFRSPTKIHGEEYSQIFRKTDSSGSS